MLEIKILNLLKLKGKAKTPYKSLIPQKLLGCLNGADPMHMTNSELIGIAALWEDKPVGLAVGAYRALNIPGELYSLFVEESHRRQGIGGKLLSKFEDILKEKGSRNAKVSYQIEQPTTSDFEGLLQQHGWKKGTMYLAKVYFDAKAFNPDWLHRDYPLPQGCELFPWKDLTKEERERLIYLGDQEAFPKQLSPFTMEHQIDWNSSLGLRNEKGVIGWMINLRPSKELIEFRSFFVFADYYLLGHAARLLSQSILLMQKKRAPRTAILDTFLNTVDNRWIKFVKRRLIPYSEKVDRFCDSWKYFR